MAKYLLSRIIRKLFNVFIKGYCYLINNILIKANGVRCQSFRINGIVYIRNSGVIKIGDNFRANSGKNKNPIGGDTILRFIVQNNACLIIGNNVGISNSTIVCCDSITIGENVNIGGGCRIWDTDFHELDPSSRIDIDNNSSSIKKAPIVISDNAFIGGGVIILKGVSIGNNSIVGAGSVVRESIPSNEVWAGNPAKFMRKL